MDERSVSTLITVPFAILAIALVWSWVSNPLSNDLRKRVPELDMAAQVAAKQVTRTAVDIEGSFQLFSWNIISITLICS